LFGKKDGGQTGGPNAAALQAEIARLNSLSLVQLAEEVMTKAFGPDGPNVGEVMLQDWRYRGPGAHAEGIASEFVTGPDYFHASGKPTEDIAKLWQQLVRMVEEGLQALEHASLVGVEGQFFFATRLGQAALERSAVDRTSPGARSEGRSRLGQARQHRALVERDAPAPRTRLPSQAPPVTCAFHTGIHREGAHGSYAVPRC
jgi:hypothetical protein